jgi:hypothetical protein
MRDKLLGILIGMLFGIGLLGSFIPQMLTNAVHRERMKAMEGGAGTYYFNPRTGTAAFQYVDLDAYTHYILGQIQAGRPVPVNPHKELQ